MLYRSLPYQNNYSLRFGSWFLLKLETFHVLICIWILYFSRSIPTYITYNYLCIPIVICVLYVSQNINNSILIYYLKNYSWHWLSNRSNPMLTENVWDLRDASYVWLWWPFSTYHCPLRSIAHYAKTKYFIPE